MAAQIILGPGPHGGGGVGVGGVRRALRRTWSGPVGLPAVTPTPRAPLPPYLLGRDDAVIVSSSRPRGLEPGVATTAIGIIAADPATRAGDTPSLAVLAGPHPPTPRARDAGCRARAPTAAGRGPPATGGVAVSGDGDEHSRAVPPRAGDRAPTERGGRAATRALRGGCEYPHDPRRNRVQHRPGPRAAARGRGVIPWPWRQPPPLRPHRHRAIGTPPTLGAVELRGRGSRFGAPRCGWSVRGHRAGAPRPGLGAGPRTGVGARAWMDEAGRFWVRTAQGMPALHPPSASPSPPPASSPVTAFIVPTPPRGRRPGRGRVGSRPVRAGGHRGRRP